MTGTPVFARRPGRFAPGRHRMQGGRHVAPRSPRAAAAAIPTLAVVLAVSGVIAAATAVAFPRATSSASIGHPAAPDTMMVRSAERSVDATQVCPIDWRKGPWHVKRLISCAAAHFGISRDQALYVAWRESRFDPSAFNARGPAAGVYQHLLRYWPDRAARYGFASASPYNARANIFVTMRMVRRVGWWPWAL